MTYRVYKIEIINISVAGTFKTAGTKIARFAQRDRFYLSRVLSHFIDRERSVRNVGPFDAQSSKVFYSFFGYLHRILYTAVIEYRMALKFDANCSDHSVHIYFE